MHGTHPDPAIQAWLDRRTFAPPFPQSSALAEIKLSRGLHVSVCLPALNEETTIGTICAAIRSELIDDLALVDELVVVDSGSDDSTVEVARGAGAEVFAATDIVPKIEPASEGKGDALWKSLAVASGDVIAWFDSDVVNFEPRYIAELIAPLLLDDDIVFAKAFHDRPIREDGRVTGQRGARVTELVARPVVNLMHPELSGFLQPLSGECAARRDVLLDIPFFTGYGVDIGLLIDVVQRHGLDAVAQVDLGERLHRNQDVLALGRMAHQVLQAMLKRLEDLGRVKLVEEMSYTLVQFEPGPGGPTVVPASLQVVERPPMRQVLHQV